VVALAASSPFARCLRDGAPVIFARPSGGALERISPEARTALRRYTSFLAAPMITRDTAVGILVLARDPGAPTFRCADTQAAADLACRAGAAIADSLALMRHRSVAEALRPPRPAVTVVPRAGLRSPGGACRPRAAMPAVTGMTSSRCRERGLG